MAVNPVHHAAYPYGRVSESPYEPRRSEEQAPRPVRRAKAGMSRGAAFRLMLTYMLICSVAIGLIYVKAQISNAQRNINTLETQIYEAQRVQSDRLELLSEAKNITVIMQRAEQLGMGYPTQDQITYLQIEGDNTSSASLQGN